MVLLAKKQEATLFVDQYETPRAREWDLKALMLRQLLQIPYVKDLAILGADNA